MQSKKQEEESYEEEEEDEQLEDQQDNVNLKQLYKNQEQFMQQINTLNTQAAIKIKQQKHKEGLRLLQQAESMLEFAASCGKVIDRNLIIVILYNQACAYQCQWVLDKCSKYLDGVIYNLEIAIKEDEADVQNLASTQEKEAQLVKKQSFLARAYLQYTAILSQLGKHKQALTNAKKSAQIMRDLFRISNQFSKDWIKKNGSQGSATTNQSNISNKSKKDFTEYDTNKKKPVFYMKDEVEFAKLVIESSKEILNDMSQQQDLEQMALSEKQLLREAKKQLYFWRNNPENNEKHIRNELKISNKEEEPRSILGVQNVQEWIENFNIGSIMHMSTQTYEEFSQYGEMIYEISKRMLLEKVIYLSISYFTIATELRFVEIDKAKLMGVKDKDIQTEEFKLSELYHLKAIEIACKHITCSSPYINHLITSYHKHYNSNLDTIQEESISSISSEINYKEQKIQKLKQVQLQTQRENKSIINKLNDQKIQNDQKMQNDSSPTGRLLNSFLNHPSPLKTNRNISDNVKPQTNLIEQMIQNKKRSDMSPNLPKNSYINKIDTNVHNQSQERITDLSQILRKQTFNEVTQNMPIQLQPYKSAAKYNLANLIKQTPTHQQQQQLKQFVFDTCRTERQIKGEPSFSPISTRNINRSPDQSQINPNNRSKIQQNKTPNNRLRTNTEQQQQLPLKLETIQQLLKGRIYNGQYKK